MNTMERVDERILKEKTTTKCAKPWQFALETNFIKKKSIHMNLHIYTSIALILEKYNDYWW